MNQVSKIIEHDVPASLVPHSDTARAVVTPMEMLDRALSSGAGVDTIERLMAMQERYEANQARKAFDEAIASAKAEVRPVVRDRAGHNKTRYASFAAIASAVDPILGKHGLSYRFYSSQTDKTMTITCVLRHAGGHREESTLMSALDISGNKNPVQAVGSTQTYLMRYSLVQMLGLASTDDDDGKGSGDGGAITDAQADQLTELLTETKSDVTKFLKWAGAESVSDIPAGRFKDAIALLQAKKGKAS